MTTKSETWPTFACSYTYQGREGTFHVQARDAKEAEERVKAICASAKVDGELVEEGEIDVVGMVEEQVRERLRSISA